MEQTTDPIYRDLFEHSIQGMVLRQDDRIVLVNRVFADMVGYAVEDLLQFSFQDTLELIHPEDRAAIQARHRDFAGKSVPDAYDCRFVRRNGDVGWWSVAISSINYKGQPAALEFYMDVTEHRRAEAMERHGRMLLSSTLDVLPIGVCLTNEAGNYQMMNDAYCAIYEYNREEMLGQHYSVIMPPDQVALANAHYVRLLSGDMGIPIERKRQRKDGSIVYIEAANALVEQPDGRKLVITVVRDITERKQAEQALIQLNAELRARNEDLNAFAHTVAHDLKNPIAVVAGYAEVLRDDYTLLSLQEIRSQLGLIASYAQKMGVIIDELLLLSSVRNLNNGHIRPLDMGRITADASAHLQKLLEDFHAVIAAPDAWPVALGYAPWVEEVWANLISNAIKYGGTPPRVELGANAPSEGQVRFWVKDNGRGLPPDEHQRIFQPFERLEPQLAMGYGLGLSIVRRIVEKLGGEVGVESVVGQGSTFFFTLPASP